MVVHFVGLDVSVKETSVCVVDDAGKVILEQKVPTGACGWLSSAGCVEPSAVARRLAVVLHRMWVDGSEFRWRKESAAVPSVA